MKGFSVCRGQRPPSPTVYIIYKREVLLWLSWIPLLSLSLCSDPAHHSCTDYGPSFFIHSFLFFIYLIKFYYYYDLHKFTATVQHLLLLLITKAKDIIIIMFAVSLLEMAFYNVLLLQVPLTPHCFGILIHHFALHNYSYPHHISLDNLKDFVYISYLLVPFY